VVQLAAHWELLVNGEQSRDLELGAAGRSSDSGGFSTMCTTSEPGPLSGGELDGIDAWWRAANYLSVGQIYLLGNPLLAEPLRPEHVKPRLLGHWGTTPGLNLIYAHLNRVIRNSDLDVIYVCGPGHGGPAMVANSWLEGTYTEMYPAVTQDTAGMARLFEQFSFPGGIPSHVAPETPGSIHEGGELGYALAHAYGAAFDNPDLIVACVIGDGEAETGPLAASWHSNKFLNPVTDGAVLPILHLNGYKIANPAVLARIPAHELKWLLNGYVDNVARLAPRDSRRMSANPHANGGLLLRDLRLPDFTDYAVDVRAPGAGESEPTRVLGDWLRDVIKGNPSNFRLFGPDETESNRLGSVYQVTGNAFTGEIVPGDNHLAPSCPLAQLPAVLAGLATGPQRLLASGPRLHRPRDDQEGRDHPRLPAARHQLPAFCRRSVPAQQALRERDRRRQAASVELAVHG
jgi:phosphoketolase